MNKRLLRYLIANEVSAGPSTSEAWGKGALLYDTRSDASLNSLIISGETDVGDEINPVGIKTEDGYKIKLRIHGARILDGYELERIMLERGSPCYGGRVDDEHFLYIAKDDGRYTIFDRTDLFLPEGNIVLEGDAVLYEPLSDGQSATGMQFLANGSRRAIPFLDTGPGEVHFKGSTGYIYIMEGIEHGAVSTEFSYAIRYDTLNIHLNGEVSEEPYCGYTAEINLDDALYSASMNYGTRICDELDVISGRLVRRVAHLALRECEITRAYYMSYPCFMISLPTTASPESLLESNAFYYSESYGFMDNVGSGTLSADGRQLYLNLGEGITTVEEARESLGEGAWVLYVRESEEEEYVSPIADYTTSGRVHIEVCSPTAPEIYATYRK